MVLAIKRLVVGPTEHTRAEQPDDEDAAPERRPADLLQRDGSGGGHNFKEPPRHSERSEESDGLDVWIWIPTYTGPIPRCARDDVLVRIRPPDRPSARPPVHRWGSDG